MKLIMLEIHPRLEILPEAPPMGKFLFIRPVNDSLEEMKPWEWLLLLTSFVTSCALLVLYALIRAKNGWVWYFLLLGAWIIAKAPMELYAQNRKGRVVGKLYLGILVAFSLYVGWDDINAQFSKYPLILPILLVLCGWAYWFTLETAKVNEQFLRKMNELQDGIHGKLSALERLIDKQGDSISFELPAPAKYGWDTIHVYPAERRCERSVSYGGYPIFHEIIEYDPRPQPFPEVVFARVVDKWTEEQPMTKSYQVINGTLLGSADDGSSSNQLRWHEQCGPEMYVILSAHRASKSVFRQKHLSIKKALKKLRAQAEAIGAVEVEEYGVIRYEPIPDADDDRKLG